MEKEKKSLTFANLQFSTTFINGIFATKEDKKTFVQEFFKNPKMLKHFNIKNGVLYIYTI